MTDLARWVHPQVDPPPGSDDGSPARLVLDQARALLVARPDIRYVMGGGHGRRPGPTAYAEHDGLDCSGFSRWVLDRAFGTDLLGNTAARDQRRRIPLVSPDEAVPGDLVFFFHFRADLGRLEWGHVGIYAGAGDVIHAVDIPGADGLRLDSLASVKPVELEFRRPLPLHPQDSRKDPS